MTPDRKRIEAARPHLVAVVRKAGLTALARDIEEGRPCKVDSWIALDAIVAAKTKRKSP